MDLQLATCPVCGGTATLLQITDGFDEVPDLEIPSGRIRIPVKIEEFRCQELGCGNEFEKIVREPNP